MNKQKIALIACVKEKKSEPCSAREMYTSPSFKSWMNYAESWGANQIYILSGKYGLLELEEEIEPYDVNLNMATSEERKSWSLGVIQKLGDKTVLTEDHFLLLTNTIYSEYLTPHLKYCSMPLAIE